MKTADFVTADYMPVGDVTVIALCFLIFILLFGSFVDKNEQYRQFRSTLLLVFLGTASNLYYHTMLVTGSSTPFIITLLRDMSYFLYEATLLFYVTYLIELIALEGKTSLRIRAVANVGFLIFIIYEVLGHVTGHGFYVDRTGIISKGSVYPLAISYVFFIGVIFFIIIRYRNRMIPQISRGILLTFILCLVLLGLQGMHHQTSFTGTVFLIPLIGFMYLLHSNPFDLSTGAVSAETLPIAVRECFKNRESFILMYLEVVDMNSSPYITREIRFDIYRFYRAAVRKPLLFHLGSSKLLLMFKIKDNREPWKKVDKLVELFKGMYDRYRLDFKAIFMESVDSLSRQNDYERFFSFVSKRTDFNEFHYVSDRDIADYDKQKLILKQLEDIAQKGDINDSRVLAYCQPVYNVSTKMYDTAEALMRLKLDGMGIIPPGLFIPLAEGSNLIHPLSLIILNKTCQAIKGFLNEGFPIKRISVNFSIPEIRDDNFCKDILKIIESNGIPYDKIAIEITESRNERDFDRVKEKIGQLKSYGIKFYLDDFGTGYSNFERIMELPFDIIKFDRSLVIESGKNKAGAFMVETFASMFRSLNYRVLYEGIEDESDESRCIEMSAQYLQGFKYSKPVEIEKFRDFIAV